tara:strand:+ start:2104 stop:2349 length:246 start_codon:yes stop_codon:yes gene_type:complete
MTISDDLTQGEKRKLYGTYNTNKQTKAKIDALMEAMAKLECTLGIDSTDEEREKVKQQQLIFLGKIKELDELKYDVLKKVL